MINSFLGMKISLLKRTNLTPQQIILEIYDNNTILKIDSLMNRFMGKYQNVCYYRHDFIKHTKGK